MRAEVLLPYKITQSYFISEIRKLIYNRSKSTEMCWLIDKTSSEPS